ncbi:MAG: YitT family protein [Lachnospiraceae bacterium]|nr:YitT family protein [Lachnospiraceae bacterium]
MKLKETVFNKRNLVTLASVTGSALLMAFTMSIFMQQASLLPAGFLGVARLVSMLGAKSGITIDASVVLLCLNLPVALFCAQKISKRFVFFSLLQVFLLSLFSRFIPTYPIFDQMILNVIFGGCIYGFSVALALRGGASTGGTDYIALYVANKTGKEIWIGVFIFNCILLAVFGYFFSWEKAGYSIVFQFISTRMVTTFHTRYKRVMMQIFTKKQDEVLKEYLAHFTHGITVLKGTGGYTGQDTAVLLSVTSSYELHEAIEVMKRADPEVIINVTNTSQFIGKFAQPKL